MQKPVALLPTCYRKDRSPSWQVQQWCMQPHPLYHHPALQHPAYRSNSVTVQAHNKAHITPQALPSKCVGGHQIVQATAATPLLPHERTCTIIGGTACARFCVNLSRRHADSADAAFTSQSAHKHACRRTCMRLLLVTCARPPTIHYSYLRLLLVLLPALP